MTNKTPNSVIGADFSAQPKSIAPLSVMTERLKTAHQIRMLTNRNGSGAGNVTIEMAAIKPTASVSLPTHPALTHGT